MAINKVRVTGEIYVPATGTELVTNGDFASDITGWNNDPVDSYDTLEWQTGKLHAVNTSGSAEYLYSDDNIATTIGKVFVMSFDLSITSGGDVNVSLLQGLKGAVNYNFGSVGSGTHTATFTSVIAECVVQANSTTSNYTLDNISVLELALGPIDTYPWDKLGDYGEDLGMFNDERVYKSKETHADGSGGAEVNYHIWFRTDQGFWYISETVGSGLNPRWFNQIALLGDYDPTAVAIGIATVAEVAGGGRYSGSGGYRKPYRTRRY
jgi:hypothetical protein